MHTTTLPDEISFTITPLPDGFARRIRATSRDDFDRVVQAVTAKGGEPARDQLRRVAAGKRIILCGYQAVPLPSAFAEIGPIFVCAAPDALPRVWCDELPPGNLNRTFALRAYNAADEIVDSALVEPAAAQCFAAVISARISRLRFCPASVASVPRRRSSRSRAETKAALPEAAATLTQA